MSITRITHFEARNGMGDALHSFLGTMVPLIKNIPGCAACVLLRNQQDTNTLVVIENWSSVDAHQTSVKQIPPAKIAEVMPLLARQPSGSYYTT